MRAVVFGFTLLLAVSCTTRTDEVVVYTSVDDVYAKGIFDAFTKETGIRVLPVFDTEEAKTLGLVHRILAEKGHPQCDVFWAGDSARTILLKKNGILNVYRSPSAADIPARWKDPDGTWTGFAVRGRTIVYNTKNVKDPPHKLSELTLPRWKGRVAIANPMFGTTASHLATLAQVRGEESTLAFLKALHANDIRVVGGNSHVRDLVARGDSDLGLTDTDDVWIGKSRGDPIEMAPAEDDIGALGIIPNTCAIIKGGPHASIAVKFVDWLLRPQTEEMLLHGPSKQTPVRRLPKDLLAPQIDWDRLADCEEFLIKAKAALGL